MRPSTKWGIAVSRRIFLANLFARNTVDNDVSLSVASFENLTFLILVERFRPGWGGKPNCRE
jgi:hypothetical protein